MVGDVVTCVAPLNDCVILSHRASSHGVQIAAKVVDKSNAPVIRGLLARNGLWEAKAEVLGGLFEC
jgi:hypothetical protein